MRYSKSTEPRKPINNKDLRRLEDEIAAAKGTPNYAVLLTEYTGPDTGVYYNDDTGYLLIHTGWHADQNGNIVRDN